MTVCALTVDKELLLVGQDAGQVRPLQATLPLGRVPRAPVAEVLVAVALELVPAVVARLCVCAQQGTESGRHKSETFSYTCILLIMTQNRGKKTGRP